MSKVFVLSNFGWSVDLSQNYKKWMTSWGWAVPSSERAVSFSVRFLSQISPVEISILIGWWWCELGKDANQYTCHISHSRFT